MLMDEYFTRVFVKVPFSFFFLTIDSHECLRENTIIIQIYSPMRKYSQHDFWNFFLTASWSGGTLPQKVCGSFAFSSVWKPRKFKLPGWLYEEFRRSHHEPPPHELTENVSCVDSDRKESSEPQDYPCFLTNRRGDIIELVDDLVLKW